MKKTQEQPSFPNDPDCYEGATADQKFIDYITGRSSIDTGDVALNREQTESPLRWAAALIRAHVLDDEKDQKKLAIAHDLEVAAQGYGRPHILPLHVPPQRKLRRGERRDQLDADFIRQILVLSVYAEHGRRGRRGRRGSLLDLAISNGFSEDQWRKWSSKTDKFLRQQSCDAGMVVTYQSQREPLAPSEWAAQVAVVHALGVANVRWAK